MNRSLAALLVAPLLILAAPANKSTDRQILELTAGG